VTQVWWDWERTGASGRARLASSELMLDGVPALTNATAALSASEVRRQRMITAVLSRLSIAVTRPHVYTQTHTATQTSGMTAE